MIRYIFPKNIRQSIQSSSAPNSFLKQSLIDTTAYLKNQNHPKTLNTMIERPTKGPGVHQISHRRRTSIILLDPYVNDDD